MSKKVNTAFQKTLKFHFYPIFGHQKDNFINNFIARFMNENDLTTC